MHAGRTLGSAITPFSLPSCKISSETTCGSSWALDDSENDKATSAASLLNNDEFFIYGPRSLIFDYFTGFKIDFLPSISNSSFVFLLNNTTFMPFPESLFLKPLNSNSSN